MLPAPRHVLAAALMGSLALTLTACGSDSGGATRAAAGSELTASPTAQATSTPVGDAKVIHVTITANSVNPDGTLVKVKRNQPIVLEIDAAAKGELHVHSTPEKHIEFPAGASQVQLKIDQPGVVDIEDHALDKLIVQLEVS